MPFLNMADVIIFRCHNDCCSNQGGDILIILKGKEPINQSFLKAYPENSGKDVLDVQVSLSRPWKPAKAI